MEELFMLLLIWVIAGMNTHLPTNCFQNQYVWRRFLNLKQRTLLCFYFPTLTQNKVVITLHLKQALIKDLVGMINIRFFWTKERVGGILASPKLMNPI